MNSRLPNIPVLMTQNSLSTLLSPPSSPRGNNNSLYSNNSNNNMESGSSSNNNSNEKLDKLKDITSKTIDQVIFKLTEMKREKQFLQSFKDIMKISETLIEIDRILKPIQVTPATEAELSRTSSSSSFSRPTTPRKDTLTSSGGSLSSSKDNNNSTNNNNTLPTSSSTLEAELIQIIHNKSNTIKKSKAHERSTDSIESVHAIIHKCLDIIKAKIVQVKKNLVFEQNTQTALHYGEMIRSIRNQVNTFRTLSLPQNLNLCDGEKLLLKVENCHYHLYDNSSSGNNHDSKSSSSSSTTNNNNNHHQKQTTNNNNNNNNTTIEDDIIKGTIFVTNYQIIFFGPINSSSNSSSNNHNNSSGNLNSNEEAVFIKQFSLHSITKWTKNGKKKSPGEYSYKLNFVCKDHRNHIISFDKTTTSLKDVRKCIENQRLTTTSTLFCFTYKQEFSKFENTNLGWNLYNAREEYARMGVPSPDWRVSDANHNFFVCDTYPALIGVPESINDEQLKAVAQFRSKGRIPSLSYRHWSNKCSITRCSQPKVGIGKNRSEEDENMLNAIRTTSTAKNSDGSTSSSSSVSNKDRKLYILDARPYANAVGNRAKGAGWEVMANYPGCVIEFLNIANIHAMRNSLNKIKESSVSSLTKEDSWFSTIESSGWMNHIKLVLQGAIRVAKLVHSNHSNVLVHCSDGWDRTSQLVALAELFLDPYFRTIRGFQVLIEKEWLSYGHKFAQRNGQIHNKDEDERSPIFYQFLEAVYQVVQQFPTKFEFNSHFLRVILFHSYSGKYGTFLFNSEKERIQNHSFGKTISLWAEMDLNIKDYINPLFVPSTIKERDVIFPDCSVKHLKIWNQIYFNNLSDTEIYDINEKVIRQVMDKHLDDRADAFKELNPLKQKRSHTASLSFSNPRQSMSISQLNLLPSFHLSNTIPKNSIELENIIEESVDMSENISSSS